jgi:DNA polymerase-3 subunit gamma/tau
MGKALYREYRPKSLDTVVGQEHITDTLQNALKKDSISHAYLFTGPRGVGKTSVARIWAYAINDIPYNEESTHLDIIEIDAASNRRIDEIRDLRDKVNIMPTSAKYKVYIIDEVHMLTREAFNALLKTLEEPPKHVVFILATTEAHKVPETIISRTQRYSFKPITTEIAIKHLRSIADSEKLDISDDALKLIANHGRGSFRDSISMLDQISSIADKKKISKEDIAVLLGVPNDDVLNDLIKSVSNNDTNEIFSVVQTLKEQGSNPSTIAQSVIKLLKDNLIANSSTLDPFRSVNLMKLLLPLTGTYSSFEGIEIALLEVIEYDAVNKNLSNNETTKEEELITETDNKKLEEIVTEAELIELVPNPKYTIGSLTSQTDKPEAEKEVFNIKSSSSNETTQNSSWNDVLNTLKTTHNTLYGVLRMADTKVENEKITLVFQFEFHKKQLEQPKNMSTLKAIINNQLGNTYEIHSTVQKKQLKKPQAKIAPQSDDTLDSVSNIFGGAELLES